MIKQAFFICFCPRDYYMELGLQSHETARPRAASTRQQTLLSISRPQTPYRPLMKKKGLLRDLLVPNAHHDCDIALWAAPPHCQLSDLDAVLEQDLGTVYL